MKSAEEIMGILEAYDLTGSYRGAAELAGCDHHTVKRLVARRDAGLSAQQTPEPDQLIYPYRDKLAEWVERSEGKLRADVAHDKLVGLGYTGSERSTRREVAKAKKAWRARNRQVYKPWIPEPGMWSVVAGPAAALTPAQAQLHEAVQALARRLRLPTCARNCPTRWPRHGRNAGTPARSCVSCSTPKPPAETPPRSPRGAAKPGSPRTRPSTAGTPPCPRSPRRPSKRCRPWSGSPDTRTCVSPGQVARAKATS